MIDRSLRKNFGYTLVEIVFVTAIVTSMSLFLTHSFSSYIDKSQDSNDQQTLKSMNDALHADSLSSDVSDYDAHDVKHVIDTYHGGSFNYTPISDNSGFFYIKKDHKIILADIDEVLEGDFKEYTCQANGDFLVNDTVLPLEHQMGQTPEEIFGDGVYMLSEYGSDVADFVRNVKGLAKSKSKPDLANNYYALQRVHQKLKDNNPAKPVIARLLEKFNVDHTVYINDDHWLSVYEESDSFDVESIVYQDRIATIPMQVESIIIFPTSDVEVPNSVQIIETHSFTQVDVKKHKVNLKVPEHAQKKDGAFTEEQLEIINSEENNEIADLATSVKFYVSTDGDDPLLQTGSIRVNYDKLDTAQILVDISELSTENLEFVEIKRVCIQGCSFFQVRAYDDQGLFGFTQMEFKIYS
jgi:hypothetical protein